jgi:hypothetical protein
MRRPAEIAAFERLGHEVTTRHEHDDLLGCRLAMLGLDLHVIERGDRETFELIKRRCTNCGCREACALDLKRDPNDPVWETYCPNAGTLNAITEASWLTPIITNYWRRHYPQD